MTGLFYARGSLVQLIRPPSFVGPLCQRTAVPGGAGNGRDGGEGEDGRDGRCPRELVGAASTLHRPTPRHDAPPRVADCALLLAALATRTGVTDVLLLEYRFDFRGAHLTHQASESHPDHGAA